MCYLVVLFGNLTVVFLELPCNNRIFIQGWPNIFSHFSYMNAIKTGIKQATTKAIKVKIRYVGEHVKKIIRYE